MMFQALLVTQDDEAAAILTPVLSGFGIEVAACSCADGIAQLAEQRFDAVLADFDDSENAAQVLRHVQASPGNHAITVALLSDKTKVRDVLGAGANFILYKPISPEQAEAGLFAASALIKRERRRSFRVPVQVPVQFTVQDAPEMEGILLDLSEEGMDILAAQPLSPDAGVSAHFGLPSTLTEIEVHGEIAWANPNGQAGVRFVDLPEDLRSTLKAWVAANAPELPPLDPEPVTKCKLTDMSLGGCYVETESPFPERSGITLGLRAEGMEVQVQGTVRVMHPGFGMGIEFPSHTAEERAQVENFIGFLSSRPGTVPELLVTPRNLTASEKPSNSAESEAEPLDDPLLELLRRHESLGQAEFLQELQRQRTPQEVEPA